MTDFSGLWIPLVTPFRDDRVDEVALARLLEHYDRAGCRGVVLAATTGEGHALAFDEKRQVLDVVLSGRRPGLGVLMGIGGLDTRTMLDQARSWSADPIDGLLATAPVYCRPSPAGCVRHFEALADTSAHPIVLYNIGYRVGVTLEIDTLERLSTIPGIVAIKECGGDSQRLHDLIARTPLTVLCGDDPQIFEAVCAGAHGAIAASAHLYPRDWVALLEDIGAQRLASARQRFARLLPLVRALFAQPNPSALKAALAQQGLIDDAVRLPMLALTPHERAALAAAVTRYEACASFGPDAPQKPHEPTTAVL